MDLQDIDLKTVDYIESLPENVRAELIDGIVFDMATPTKTHQALVGEFTRVIGNYIHDNKGECRIYPSPFAVYLNNDKLNYFEPDITVVCDTDKLDEKGCHGAPDWIIEIVSPSSRSLDYVTKLNKYRNAGVREYWIVNPDRGNVLVYRFETDDYAEQYSFDDAIPVGIYPGLQIRVSDLQIG